MILPGESHSPKSHPLRSAPHPVRFLTLPYTNAVISGVVDYVCYNHVLITLLKVDGKETVGAQGVIHREDSMFGIKDSDKLNELFSPGDIVHGRVLSLGDTGPVVVSTADESHGVVKATDFATETEIRLTQGQFIFNKEILKRKVAKL